MSTFNFNYIFFLEPTCTQNISDYPKEAINLFLNNETNIAKYSSFFDEYLPVTYEDRFSDNSIYNDQSLCQSRIKYFEPQCKQATDQTWIWIVNHEGYTQKVRGNICR